MCVVSIQQRYNARTLASGGNRSMRAGYVAPLKSRYKHRSGLGVDPLVPESCIEVPDYSRACAWPSPTRFPK